MTFTARLKAFFQPVREYMLFSGDSEFTNQQAQLDHRALIMSVSDRYNMRKHSGVQECRMVVDFRADWISGNGLIVKSNNTLNQEFITRFDKYNKTSSVAFRNWAIGGEIEGRQLLALSKGTPEDEDPWIPISVKAISWVQHDYRVRSLDGDPDNYSVVEIPSRDNDVPKQLSYDQTVYVKLQGEERFVNSPVPVAAVCDADIQAIADCYDDMRRLNQKIGAGFYHAETPDLPTADEFNTQLRARNFKIGTTTAGPYKISYNAPTADARNNFIQEILRRSMRITGISGVPAHFVGLIDLFGTKAGAEELTQVLNSRTANDRTIWKNKIEELYKKAMIMDREVNNSALDPDDISVEIPQGTVGQLGLLTSVYLPLYQEGVISKECLQSKIPGYNIEEDKPYLEEQETKSAQKQQDDLRIASAGIFQND